MFVLGLVSGITMSIGTFLITQLYEGRQRGSDCCCRLLLQHGGDDFSYGRRLLARSIEWYWVYACIGTDAAISSDLRL